MFSFEAGRRCDSGPGNFTFETKQGNEIFSLVDKAIQLQKDLAEDRHLSGPQSLESDCLISLQNIRNALPGGVASGSGDSSSCSSREADGDSGGSKPGSADGVLGKREGGDGGGGKGQGSGAGIKGRSLPEPPGMLVVLGGGGTPPRSPRGKGTSSLDETTALYSEPADSVRVPVHGSDGLYSDPVDSIKVPNQTPGPLTPPVPSPRHRSAGDDASGGVVPGDHHPGANNKKVPDLYSHVYDQIGQDLNQKTNALKLNGGVGGGRGAGRGKNDKRPPGVKLDGSSSPPGPSLDHIYDEPEGCAKGSTVLGHLGMTVYDEARLEPPTPMRPEEVGGPSGPEGTYSNPSKGKQSEPQRQSPKQPGRGGTPQPPAPRWPKPATAPKPNKGPVARKEPVPLPPGKHGSNVNNNNNNNAWSVGGGGKEVYSKVSKQKPPPAHLWYKQAPLTSPDLIYDNLGDI